MKRRFYSGVPRLVVFLYLLSCLASIALETRSERAADGVGFRQRGEPQNKKPTRHYPYPLS
jgi:hypothetical protein